MKRLVRGFHFRYWASKTDHYGKRYPDFSLGWSFNSETLFNSYSIRDRRCITTQNNASNGYRQLVWCLRTLTHRSPDKIIQGTI